MECGECKIDKSKLLGKGGYGKVYLTCCDDGCDYATKVIKISKENKEQYDSINKELNLSFLMAKENVGPKICNKYTKIVETEEGGDALHIVMEKFEMTMSAYVIRNKVIDSEMQLKIYNVISRLHELGFVHLDLHLGNLMIDKKGNVKIIDFGSTELNTSKLLRYFDFFSTYKNLKIFDEKGILFTINKQTCDEFNVKFSSKPQEFYKQFDDNDNEFIDIVKKTLEIYKNKEEKAVKFKCKFIILLAKLYRYWYISKEKKDIKETLEIFFKYG